MLWDMELPQGSGRIASYIVQSGAISAPIVIVDIGARGGIDARWKPIEQALEVYGFDPSVAVEPSTETQHFFKIAVSNSDGEMPFRLADNPFESKFDPSSTETVPVARLDTLYQDGRLPKADFLKVDVEGYETSVLDGAVRYMNASNLLGADIETNFNTSEALPHSHFHAITCGMRSAGLRIANFAMQSPAGHPSLPWPGVCNAFYCRDLLDGKADIQRVLKLIVILDMYRMNGHIRELVSLYRDAMPLSIDPLLLNEMLTAPRRLPVEDYLPHLGLGLLTWIKGRISTASQPT